MGDSPQASETFVRQFYPAEPSLEAHHDAIVAQARQHERAIMLARHTHQRVCSIDAAVARIESHQQDLKLMAAEKKHSTALKQAGITAAGSLVAVLLTLLGQYVMRPAPAQAPELAPQTLEAIRLYEQRTGYKLGQRPPGGGEPEPFVAPATPKPAAP